MYAGSASSGKSEALYCEILKEAIKHPEKQYKIIVTQQATNEVEKRLIELNQKLFGRPGFMNVDVLSFGRFSFRIFSEAAIVVGKPLDEYEKAMLIRLAAGKAVNNLTIYQNSIRRQGFLDKVKQSVSELIQYDIIPEELKKIACGLEKEGCSELLTAKLRDLSEIYEEYMKCVSYDDTGYLPENRLKKAADILDDEKIRIKSADKVIFAFDEFISFTPDQMYLIKKLKKRAERLIFTQTLDKAQIESTSDWKSLCDSRNNLFAPAMRNLLNIISSMEGKPEFVWTNIKSENEALQYQRENIFRYPIIPFKRKTEGEIRLLESNNPLDEIRFIAAEIREKVRTEGMRYKDFAIVAPDIDETFLYSEEIFKKYEIPVFYDTTKVFSKNPYSEGIQRLLNAVIRDFDYESVFGFMKMLLAYPAAENGKFTDLTRDIEDLENRSIASGIRGKKSWQQEIMPYAWNGNITEEEKEYAGRLENVRKLFMYLVEPLLKGGNKNTAENYIDAVMECMDENHLAAEKSIDIAADEMFKSGRLDLAGAYSQLWHKMTEMFAETKRLLGKTELTIQEFSDMIKSGMENIKIGIIPSTLDSVTFGSLTRSKIPPHVKNLYIIHVNDGKMPSNGISGKLLTDQDKEIAMHVMKDIVPGKYFAPTEKVQSMDESFYFYQMISKPSESVIISYDAADRAGSKTEKSFFTGRIEKIFPWLKPEKTDYEKYPGTAESKKLKYSANMRRAATEENLENYSEIISMIAHYREYSGMQNVIIESKMALSDDKNPEKIPNEVMDDIVIPVSVSSIETYSDCPYEYFLNYVIGISPRKTKDVNAIDAGSIIHSVMEKVLAKLTKQSGSIWNTVKEEELNALSDLKFEDVWNNYLISRHKAAEADEDGLTILIKDKLKALSRRSVCDTVYQICKGKMLPYKMEEKFNYPIEAKKPGGEIFKININGRIDRIDKYEDENNLYFRVIDYKTGNTEFEPRKVINGTQIQLSAYAGIYEKILHNQTEKNIVPLGMYYSHLKNAVMKLDILSKENAYSNNDIIDMAEKQRIKELRLSGIVNDDPEEVSDNKYENLLLQEIDILDSTHKVKKGEILPIGPGSKKGAEDYSDLSPVASGKNILGVMNYGIRKIAETTELILTGDISKHPVHYLPDPDNRANACSYCDYRNVCRFDRKKQREKKVYKENGSMREQIMKISVNKEDSIGKVE